MAEEFVNLVVFKPVGLDQIEKDLNRVKMGQDQLAKSTNKVSESFQKAARSAVSFDRSARTSTMSGRVREAEQLVRQHERLTRLMERQTVLGRMGSAAGRAGSFALGAAGAVGAGALGMGIAGLSGTVPMAKFQNQLQRLQWELGNTLTPILGKLTQATAGAANWLGRRSESEQNLIGYGVAGLTVAGGGAFLNKLGVPIGPAIRGGASWAYGAASRALGYGAKAAPTAAEALYAAQYGRYGLPAAESAGIGMAGALRFAGPIAWGATAAGSQFALKYNTANMLARSQGQDLGNQNPYYDEYGRKFAGLEGKARKDAILSELGVQVKAERSGIMKYYGEGGNKVEQMAERLLSGFGLMSMGDTGEANEANRRQAALRGMLSGKGGGDHRANAFVGGDFREIGQGYYEAASAYAKSGMDKAAGGSLESNVQRIADTIDKAVNGSNEPVPPGGGGIAGGAVNAAYDMRR